MEGKLGDFINKNNGKQLKVLPNEDAPQCFDIPVAWCDILGVPHFPNNPSPFPVENATQIFTDFTDWQLQYFDKIENAADNFPSAGDIVVFGKGINHVVVATVGSNKDTLQCFSQNDPLFSPCILKDYDYSHVLGWLHFNPKMTIAQSLYSQLVANSTAYDFVCDAFKIARNSGLERITEAIGTLNDHMTAIESQLEDEHKLNKTLTDKIQVLSNIPVVAAAHPTEITPIQPPVVVVKPQPEIPQGSITLYRLLSYYAEKLGDFLKTILLIKLPNKNG